MSKIKPIEELLDATCIGYACVSSATIKKDDISTLQETKAYQNLAQQLSHYAFGKEIKILVDVIAGPNRKRHRLEEIIETFKVGINWAHDPKGVLVIEDISALGTTPEIAAQNYEKLVLEHIGIWICGEGANDFSTADSICEYIVSPEQRLRFVDEIRQFEIKTKRGTKKTVKQFSPEFKELYWLYENYFIPDSIVYENKIIGKTTHNTFDRYCAAYEHSPEYAADEEAQLVNDINKKPKRFGRAPANFGEYASAVINGNMTIEDACKELGMTPITFDRFIRKGTGRQAMSWASKEFRNQRIIDEITIEK